MGVDPVTLGALAAGGAMLGGGILKGKGIVDQAEAEAQAAEYNRLLALRRGRLEEDRRRRLARRELSSQRVAFAKSGVRLEGSPLELLAQNAAELERDSIQPRIEGQVTADLQRRRIRSIRRAGQTAAQANALETFGKVGSTAAQFFGPGGGGG